MSTQMLDVLSVLDKDDEPVLGNCTLQMGEVALEFKNGRSVVPLQHAPEVLRHPKIKIPGYTGAVAPLPPNEAADLPPIGDVRQHRNETVGEREARMREAEVYLRQQGLAVPERALSAAEEIVALRARLAELEGAPDTVFPSSAAPAGTLVVGDGVVKTGVPAGQEGTLEVLAPGEEPRAAPEEIPEGFEALTQDGKPRCWTRTAGGTQCLNAALEGSTACGLSAHQK